MEIGIQNKIMGQLQFQKKWTIFQKIVSVQADPKTEEGVEEVVEARAIPKACLQ